MSYREIIEWNAYLQLDPTIEDRLDYSTGLICSTIVNMTPRKDKRIIEPKEFIPKYYQPNISKKITIQSWQEQEKIAQLITDSINKTL